MDSEDVGMTYEEGFEIISRFKKQATLKSNISAKTPKEKAILLDALNLMYDNIDNKLRYSIAHKRWNETVKANKQR